MGFSRDVKVHGGDRLHERRHSLKTYVLSPHLKFLIRTTVASRLALHKIAVPRAGCTPKNNRRVSPKLPLGYTFYPPNISLGTGCVFRRNVVPPDCILRIFCSTCSV